jgi:type II secretory pathway pseudopilin PulG
MRRGQSILEVLIGIFVVGCAAMILAATLPVASGSRIKAEYENRASGVAQKQLERIRGAGYANLTGTQLHALGFVDSATPASTTQTPPTSTFNFTNSDSGSNDNVSVVLPSGTGQVVIGEVDLDLRSVTVTVNWTERGQTRTFSVGTLVANL